MLILFLILSLTKCDDILVYQPLLMPSHAAFMARLVEVLADANYSVVVLVNAHREDVLHGCDKAKEIIVVPPVKGLLDGCATDPWKVKQTPDSQWEAMRTLTIPHGRQCKALLDNEEALSQLRGRKFRTLIHEVFDMCGLVIGKLLKVDKQIIVSSTRQMDTVGYEIGLTDPFRHAGLLADYGSTIGWTDVFRNAWFIDSFLKFTDNQVDYYKMKLKSLNISQPLRKLSRSACAVFLNTHPLTDSWRPSLRNVYDFGGIALHSPKALPSGLESQLKRWKTVILISFGTVSPSSKMPENWKKNLVTVIESFPEVLFLWKYEVEDSFSARKLPNIIMSPFFPQNDLLHSGLVDVFITHGGQNSIIEAASAGVRMLVIPQFGDQFRNSQAVKERKLGRILFKENLESYQILREAIDEIIKEDKIHKKVSHLINTDFAVQTFLTKMEEALDSNQTFEESPEPWDIVRILNYVWSIMCTLAAAFAIMTAFRLYNLFRSIYTHLKKC